MRKQARKMTDGRQGKRELSNEWVGSTPRGRVASRTADTQECLISGGAESGWDQASENVQIQGQEEGREGGWGGYGGRGGEGAGAGKGSATGKT